MRSMSTIKLVYVSLALPAIVAAALIGRAEAQGQNNDPHADPSTDSVNVLSMDGVRRSSLGSQNGGMQYGYRPVFKESVTAYTGQEQIDEQRKKIVEIGRKESKSSIAPIRSNQGFMQVADMDETAKMLKGMIKMKVPVMYQTMMMVENGAATGFIGAIGNMLNLTDQTIQGANLQLAMYEAFDPGGQRAHEYAKAVFDGLQTQSHNNSWPLALWAASSDELDPSKAHSDVNGAQVQHKYMRPQNELGGPGLNPNISDNAPNGQQPVTQTSLTDLIFESIERGQ